MDEFYFENYLSPSSSLPRFILFNSIFIHSPFLLLLLIHHLFYFSLYVLLTPPGKEGESVLMKDDEYPSHGDGSFMDTVYGTLGLGDKKVRRVCI